jgi:hypothetical protein
MKLTLLFLSLSVTIFSCSETLPEKDLSIVPAVKSATLADTVKTATVSNLPVQMPVNPVNVMPQNNVPMPQNILSSSKNTTTAPGLNPAHGQPGHRCDIKEGAPLNSAPVNVKTASNIGSSQMITAPQQKVNTSTPAPVIQKGMNPVHGQPGHRCDIAVGAPLNSPPGTPVATKNASANITQMPAPAQNAPVAPALQNSTINTSAPKSSGAFTGKLNPAHGQPGHDCKVAVGQPLP